MQLQRRMQGIRGPRTGLAAKTEEDERRRTGKRRVDLTLNEIFYIIDVYLKRRKGETRRAGATIEEKSMCRTRDLHAEGGHQDAGLESSTNTSNFVFSGSL